MSVEVGTAPCWQIQCDRCGDGETEYGNCYHHESQGEAEQSARDHDWFEHEGFWLCASCVENYAEDVPCPVCLSAAEQSCRRADGWRLPHLERLVALIARERASAQAAQQREADSDA